MEIVDALRLQVKIDENGCWLWQGSINHGGYGRVTVSGKRLRAHRLSYETFRGEIPKGLLVCHSCDVRSCINPDHLFLGTHADNTNDAKVKGRIAAGTKHYASKLTLDQVSELIRRYKAGEAPNVLASQFGVHVRHVWGIATGRFWKDVAR